MSEPIGGARLVTAELRRSVGGAVWLFSLLVNLAPAEWITAPEGSVWVAGGKAISDKQLADALDASPKEIARWRSRLRSHGLLGWHIVPGRGRAFWLISPQSFRESNALTATVREIWNVVQERSIGITGKLIEDLNPQELSRVASALAVPSGAQKENQ